MEKEKYDTVIEDIEKVVQDLVSLKNVGARQSAKALRHGSVLYTKDGCINIEDVKVGDYIYGNDGKLTKIIGVYPQGIKDIYKISLLDRIVNLLRIH